MHLHYEAPPGAQLEKFDEFNQLAISFLEGGDR